MRRRKTPERCDCPNRGEPSPWHCICGRWKPAASEQCEVCLGAERELEEYLRAVAA